MSDEREKIQSYLTKMIKQNGGTLSRSEYKSKKRKFSYYQIKKEFGSWSDAINGCITDPVKEVKKLRDTSNVFKGETKN